MTAATTITRREAVTRIAAIMGAVAIGSELFLTGCRHPDAERRTGDLSAQEVALLDDVGETTIPGAKAVGIGAFMARMAKDCYDDASWNALRGGVDTLGKSFTGLAPAARTELLNKLDAEQREHTKNRAAGEPPHYYRLMKELTLIGYFTSEVGCTQAMRYVESPGRYDGNVPYAKGDKAWFNPSRRIS
ncbi:MAG: gluconate 2-dehydrogenase subunit 3 family protein [Gemmatimonadaceae bacterium]